MTNYTEYAERVSERYGVLQPIGQPPVSWEEGAVALYARRGPAHAGEGIQRFRKSLSDARKRVRQDRTKELLGVRPEYELLWRVPFGSPTSIEDIVRRESRVVLLSEAGGGKTTALRYLAAHRPVWRTLVTEEGEVERHDLVTIMVDLPNLAGRSLPEYLSEDAQRQMSLALGPEFFAELLANGQAVVCIDGLDEIPGQEERAKVVRQIESWVDQFPLCRYVVTARSDAYDPSLSRLGFAHHVLTPWNEAVSADLERAWREALDGWTVKEADRPFYVERHRLWQHLALAMRIQNRRSASVEEAQDWLVEAVLRDKKLKISRQEARGEVELLLQESVPHLAMVQRDDGQLSFAPRLLQDILAARALETLCAEKSVRAAWEEAHQHLRAGNWRETLVLMSRFLAQDHAKPWSRFAARVLDAGEDDSLEPALHRHLLLVASALGDPSNELDRAMRKRAIDGLLSWMTDPEAIGRQDAIDVLFKLSGEPYAVEQVWLRAGDDSLDVWSREAAVLLLGVLGRTRANDAVEALQTCVDNTEESDRVRMAAVTALGALGSSGALDDELQAAVEDALLERVRDPELSIDVRVALAESLTVVLASTQRDLILETLIALARNENKREDKVPYSVQTAGARGVCHVLPGIDDTQLVERLWGIAQEEEVDDTVRRVLAEALGKLDDAAKAAAVLIGLSRSPKVYPPGQRDVLAALGRVGYAEQSVVDEVIEIAETKDRKVKDFVRLAAAHALGELGYVALSVQHLLMLIADKSIYRTTRNEAFVCLGEMGSSGDAELDDAAISVLQIWVTEDNTTEDVRECAMDSLIMLRAGREDVIRDMIRVIQDKSVYPRVRRSAAEKFGSLPVEQKQLVVDALSATFYDQDEKSDLLRVPIARLLYLWGKDEHALRYLKLAAKDSYMALVRYKAAMILLELGEMEPAVAELLRLAQNADISDVIRHDALRALGLWTVGNEEVAEAIAPIAQNAELESNVRDAAYASLRSITAA